MLPSLKEKQQSVTSKLAELSKNPGDDGAAAVAKLEGESRSISEMVQLAQTIAQHPENSSARQRLAALIERAKETATSATADSLAAR